MAAFHYHCFRCGADYPAGPVYYLCPRCAGDWQAGQPPPGVLQVRYPTRQIRQNGTGTDLFHRLESVGFAPLVPLQKGPAPSHSGIGHTPLIPFPDPENPHRNHAVLLKDDSRNPTFSFKDRASELVSAFAAEKGFPTLVAASTGNAGSSLAGICAGRGQKAVVLVPATAPRAKLLQILLYGARLVPVDGTYDTAFALSLRCSDRFGWYNRNTAYNPLTIEGKKTVAYELFSQCGHQAPDLVFVPTGDGVILAGVYKGFEDLLELGIINTMPRLVAVQAEGSNSILRNFRTDGFIPSEGRTLADSIAVSVPANYHLARHYLLRYQGMGVEVTDEAIREAGLHLARNAGILTEPAGAAAWAGYRQWSQSNPIEPGAQVVVLLTGSGLKDPQAFAAGLTMPDPVEPDPEKVAAFLTETI